MKDRRLPSPRPIRGAIAVLFIVWLFLSGASRQDIEPSGTRSKNGDRTPGGPVAGRAVPPSCPPSTHLRVVWSSVIKGKRGVCVQVLIRREGTGGCRWPGEFHHSISTPGGPVAGRAVPPSCPPSAHLVVWSSIFEEKRGVCVQELIRREPAGGCIRPREFHQSISYPLECTGCSP